MDKNNNFLFMLLMHIKMNSARKKQCKLYWQDPARTWQKMLILEKLD